MSDIEQIKHVLCKAAAHDLAARDCRRQAGRLLASVEGHHRGTVLRELELDSRSADLLIEIGAGGRPAAHG